MLVESWLIYCHANFFIWVNKGWPVEYVFEVVSQNDDFLKKSI